jgi:hypothetical protein
MKGKGIRKPLPTKTKDEPAKSILDSEWKLSLVKKWTF